MRPVKERADYVIDTSNLATAQLRAELLRIFSGKDEKTGMTVAVTSFGFKYGLPLEADLVLDVRFMIVTAVEIVEEMLGERKA